MLIFRKDNAQGILLVDSLQKQEAQQVGHGLGLHEKTMGATALERLV
jgi:hypothetical protein